MPRFRVPLVASQPLTAFVDVYAPDEDSAIDMALEVALRDTRIDWEARFPYPDDIEVNDDLPIERLDD